MLKILSEKANILNDEKKWGDLVRTQSWDTALIRANIPSSFDVNPILDFLLASYPDAIRAENINILPVEDLDWVTEVSFMSLIKCLSVCLCLVITCFILIVGAVLVATTSDRKPRRALSVALPYPSRRGRYHSHRSSKSFIAFFTTLDSKYNRFKYVFFIFI